MSTLTNNYGQSWDLKLPAAKSLSPYMPKLCLQSLQETGFIIFHGCLGDRSFIWNSSLTIINQGTWMASGFTFF